MPSYNQSLRLMLEEKKFSLRFKLVLLAGCQLAITDYTTDLEGKVSVIEEQIDMLNPGMPQWDDLIADMTSTWAQRMSMNYF